MDPRMLTLVFQSVACIALIAFVLLKFWSEARLDAFRQRIFAIRDQLWDYAADGNVGFDDPAYRLLRQSMNGLIRYGHQLTFFRVCITALEFHTATQPPRSNWSENWQSSLKRLSNEAVRTRLEEFHAQAMQVVANRLIMGSPTLLLLVVLSIPLLMLRMGWLNLKAILRKAPTFTVSHVVDTQMLENEAAATAIA